MVATKRVVSHGRPSTRSQQANHEKTGGMARRLRYENASLAFAFSYFLTNHVVYVITGTLTSC